MTSIKVYGGINDEIKAMENCGWNDAGYMSLNIGYYDEFLARECPDGTA
jgi:hypothetical protein